MTPKAATVHAIMYINFNTSSSSSGHLLPNYTVVNGGTYGLQPGVNYDLSDDHGDNYGDSEMMSFYYKDDIEQLRKPWVRESHFIPLTLVYGFVFIVGKCTVCCSLLFVFIVDCAQFVCSILF